MANLLNSSVVMAASLLVLAAAEPRCPEGMVPTGVGTCIDRYEWPNRRGELPLVGLSALPEPADAKAGRVLDAEALCSSVGKRVCELEEWRAACRYEAGKWPDGAQPLDYEPGQLSCNYDKRYRGVLSEYRIQKRDPREFERVDQREPSGARAECRSVSGAYDMVGNVEEWVRCPSVGAYGWCLVGRHWAEPQSCEYVVVKHAPRWHYAQQGTRCCLGGE